MNLEVRLSKLHAFRHFDAKALELFASSLELRSYKEGDVLLAEGSSGDAVFILLEGTVEYVHKDHGPIRKATDDEHGQLVGLMTLLLGQKRNSTVRADTEVKVGVLTRYAFDLLYRHDGPASMPFCELVSAQLVADARTVHNAFFEHESLHGREVSEAELNQSQAQLNATLTGVQSMN